MALFTLKSLNLISSNKRVVSAWYFLVISIFVLFVFFPTVYVLVYAFTRVDVITSFVIGDPTRLWIVIKAVALSFAISLTVTAIDLIFGLVIAWVIAKKDFRGKTLVNTLIESPLSIPTAGLGFSVALFWAVTPGITNPPFGALQFIRDPFFLIILFHFTTTFPYVVRSLTEILEEIDSSYEIAALTCGANKLTAARTITLPMFRSGIATAATLVMAKSLSDTGGVVSLLTTLKGSKLVETDTIQGTALIDIWKGLTKPSAGLSPSQVMEYEAALAFVAFLMIFLALVVMFLIRRSINSFKTPKQLTFPHLERRISKGLYVHFRNAISMSFLTLMVFVPSFFILSYIVSHPIPTEVAWGEFFDSIFNSFLVASVATIINVVLGVPIAVYITRKAGPRLSSILDSIIDIPYLVPSAAVGISVFLFWKSDLSPLHILNLPDIVLVIFAHMAMTFPFITRNVIGGLEDFDVSIEETARTLGARPLQVFRGVTLPSIVGSILAGAVMGFTRSVGETGATLAVSSLQTAPVYIVNQIKVEQNYVLAAVATLLLTLVGYVFIWGTKILLNYSVIRKDIQKVRNSLREWRRARITDI